MESCSIYWLFWFSIIFVKITHCCMWQCFVLLILYENTIIYIFILLNVYLSYCSPCLFHFSYSCNCELTFNLFLISIYLITCKGEHLFLCWLAIWIFLFEKHFFMSFVCFFLLYDLMFFLPISFKNTCILYMNLVVIPVSQISSPILKLVFSLVMFFDELIS